MTVREEKNAIRLDHYYAAKWTAYGLQIFSYFEDEGEIRQSIHQSPIILGEQAQAILAHTILLDVLFTAGCGVTEGQDG